MIAELVAPAKVVSRAKRLIHVLTLTPFFPLADDDASGGFVAEPLPWMERLGIANTVIAARPFYRGSRATNRCAIAEWVNFFSIPSNAGLPSAGRFLHASILRRVQEIHRSDPVDLIHAHSALPCGHAAGLIKRELGIPFVVGVHGLDAFSAHQAGRLVGSQCARISRWVYRAAERVICVSKKVEEKVLQGTACQARTEVVYNGVDPELFSPADESAGTLLSVGNLIPIKNHELLLRAFAAIAPNFPNLRWDIIGDGPERGRLYALVNKLSLKGRACFLGQQSRVEVARAMQRCAVFALPSRYEALGCVYLEAMAGGRPVIACRGQGIDEVIEHGNNGWLVDGDSVEELVSALNLLLANSRLRERLGQAARTTILNGFTLQHQARRLVDIYGKCIA